MDRTLPLALLPSFTASQWSLPGVRATNSTPYGCSPAVSVLHYNLCDLDAVWGVVVEALAAAGAVTAFILLVVLVASLPFVTAEGRRSAVGLQAGLLVCTLGLFGLAFAFIVGRDFAVCVARRFLFGVLFAGCFSCLLAHAVSLNALARRGRGYRGWQLCLAAAGLWVVEAIVNTLWLVVTVARYPISSPEEPVPCAVTNPDFAMALIYVMVLLLAVPVAAAAALGGGRAEWRRPAAFILLTGVLSAGIWVAWVVMYVYGNRAHGGPGWDDPALAIALVTNGWVFLALYVIPEVAALQGDSKDPETPEGDSYPPERVGYETILNGQKDQSSHNVYVENKGFTMDEPNTAGRPVSPYSGYNGQIRGCVYQPTELALITKGLSSRMDNSRESGPPWVTSASLPQSSWSYTARPDERRPVPGQSHGGGNGLQVRPMW
ncbi:G-protein coupled receptor family C group 5 member C-like isoform X2 [Anguilla rostrata]|uniref:G-protein coupled receptor family C group 5 member C-like isoform X2 n=1 Tax=Anguilla rostrata TaxID=7938 RepID=UPI0030D1BBD0